MKVRSARLEDASAIAQIAHASWPLTYRGLLEDDFIRRVLAETYTQDALRAAIADSASTPSALFLVAEVDCTVVGYLHFAPGPKGLELHRLYVHPEHVRSGAGTALMGALHASLPPGTSYVALVHASNEPALRFYRRFGAVAEARVDGRRLFFERSGLRSGRTASEGEDILLRVIVPAASR